MDLAELKKEIPYKWRVQSFSKFKPECSCVAYVDARDVMDLLDDVCGPENWSDQYQVINGHLYCKLSIKIGDEWVGKTDAGSESNIEKGKGEASDAFKRAAVKWGIGRFLYSLKIYRLDANEKKAANNYPYPVFQGNRIYDITSHINGLIAATKTAKANPAPNSLRAWNPDAINKAKEYVLKGYDVDKVYKSLIKKYAIKEGERRDILNNLELCRKLYEESEEAKKKLANVQ